MIDPTNITNFNLSIPQLEERILWWVLAAGKNGVVAAKQMEKLKNNLLFIKNTSHLFQSIKAVHESSESKNLWLASMMMEVGIGCYNRKSQTFIDLAYSGLNLERCNVQDLEKIKGIGPKTARGFILHSRPNQRHACLDTHILKWLKIKGYDVPKSTPSGKTYLRLEQCFLNICDDMQKKPAELDLQIWNEFRK